MKNKLIKLSDTHYIIVDDSEIKQGDWFIDLSRESYRNPYLCDIGPTNLFILTKDINFPIEGCKKITHSTQPLEQYYGVTGYYKIKQLSISDVEEAIYNLEEFAWNNPILSRKEVYDLFHKVFKDKKLDGQFCLSASKQIHEFDDKLREISKINAYKKIKKLPNIVWDIEINSENKITLI